MIDDYRKARKRGKKQVGEAISAGRHPFLPSLDEALEGRGSAGEVPVGVREIPMDLIVGTKTKGRSNVFSRGFMPIADETTEFASKWSDLCDAQMTEGIRDPIVAYEYLQRFYVQEGNKRVSVLRYLGAPSILASVTRVLPAPSDDGLTRRYHEFERLYRVAPIYGLIFTAQGSCERLARLLGHDLEHAWPEEDVRDLALSLRQFGEAYRNHGGASLEGTVADAFLVYLKSYATSGPLCVTAREMDERVGHIWDELVVASRGEIAYIEDPSKRRVGLSTPLRGLGRGLRPARTIRIAFVYDRDPATSGWVALHEQGRNDLQRRLGPAVDTIALTGRASDEDFDRAIDAAIADGDDIVVTASPRQMEQTRRAAVAHPDTVFINCSINLSSSAVRTFYARMYEVKFLMGALAASLAENHRVGYVAVSPIYGSVAEINAFAIGASMVDPYASVYLKWLSAEGYDWQRELRDDDVRVVAGLDYSDPAHPTNPYGLYRVHEDGESEQVAVPVWDWGRYYELIVHSVQDDTWRKEGEAHKEHALNYWWGLSADVIRLDLKEGLPNGPRRLVKALKRAFLDGILHPFADTLVAQRGVLVKGEEDPRLSNEQIASMRWLNGNVVGRLPKQWELSKEGSEAVAVSGVISEETDVEDN